MLTPCEKRAAPFRSLGDVRDRLLRPALGFSDPFDVLKDPGLGLEEKRAILSSWASDACAVEDHPTQRWLIGAEAPVPVQDVLDALARLDRVERRLN